MIDFFREIAGRLPDSSLEDDFFQEMQAEFSPNPKFHFTESGWGQGDATDDEVAKVAQEKKVEIEVVDNDFSPLFELLNKEFKQLCCEEVEGYAKQHYDDSDHYPDY